MKLLLMGILLLSGSAFAGDICRYDAQCKGDKICNIKGNDQTGICAEMKIRRAGEVCDLAVEVCEEGYRCKEYDLKNDETIGICLSL